MSVLYHLTTLPPKMPRAEAISQEIARVREEFHSDVVYVNPNQQSPVHLPRLLFGFHKLGEIRRREAGLQLHHVYNPDAYPFPYLLTLQCPVIYYVTCGVPDKRLNRGFFSSLAAVAVSDRRSLERLKSWGLDNVALVHPGIDTERFSYAPLPLVSRIRLMVGSAPWTKRQFRTKGVDALLTAAQREPRLELIFLWRGVLLDDLMSRVQRRELQDQVTVLNRLVDVNSVLARVHASVTLAAAPGIVKSYPHSLLESLAAGKPVLISRAIPMADYVERTGCGVVVNGISPGHILSAVELLAADYARLEKSAREIRHRDFSEDRLLDSFRTMYENVLGHPLGGERGSR